MRSPLSFKSTIACLTTLSVSAALTQVPQASAGMGISAGQAYVDIVGRDINPTTGEIGWSAFAEVPRSFSLPSIYANEMSFVLPAECIEKPRIVNARQPEDPQVDGRVDGIDGLYQTRGFIESANNGGGYQGFYDEVNEKLDKLSESESRDFIQFFKDNPEMSVSVLLSYPHLAYKLNELNKKFGIDPNFSLNALLPSQNKSDFDEASVTRLTSDLKLAGNKSINSNDDTFEVLDRTPMTMVEKDAPLSEGPARYSNMDYAMVLGKVSYTNEKGEKEYKTFYRRIKGTEQEKLQLPVVIQSSDYSPWAIPLNSFVTTGDYTIYEVTSTDKYGSTLLDYPAKGSQFKNPWSDESEWPDDLTYAAPVLQKVGEVSELNKDNVNSKTNELLSKIEEFVHGLDMRPLFESNQLLYTNSALFSYSRDIALHELPTDQTVANPEPREFVKVTDKNTGKQFWQRTIYTTSSLMAFDVEAKADLGCLREKGLMKPGTTFYIPAQWFWKNSLVRGETDRIYSRKTNNTADDIKHPLFLGITTKDNPNGVVAKQEFSNRKYVTNKPYDQWVIHPPVNNKTGEFITRGILEADRTNSYDMRQGIYDNPFCMVSRNVNFKDSLNTGITDFDNLAPIDTDDQFPGEKKNGITNSNWFASSRFVETEPAYGSTSHVNAFSVEDMCDQAGAKITVPDDTPVTTTVVTPVTETITTTLPPTTEVVTTTPEPTTKVVTTTPPPNTVIVTTPVSVTKTIEVTPPAKTIVTTTTSEGVPTTLTKTITPEPSTVIVTEPGKPATFTSVITPAPETSTQVITPPPTTVTNIVTPPPTTITNVVTATPTTVTAPAEPVIEKTIVTPTTTVTPEPTTVIETPETSSSSSSFEMGSILKWLAIFAPIGIFGLLITIFKLGIPQPEVSRNVVTPPPAKEPTPAEDHNIIIKDGVACPATGYIKGVCKPIK